MIHPLLTANDIDEQLRSLVPNLLYEEYTLQQDVATGGHTITAWTNPNPQPTEADIERAWFPRYLQDKIYNMGWEGITELKSHFTAIPRVPSDQALWYILMEFMQNSTQVDMTAVKNTVGKLMNIQPTLGNRTYDIDGIDTVNSITWASMTPVVAAASEEDLGTLADHSQLEDSLRQLEELLQGEPDDDVEAADHFRGHNAIVHLRRRVDNMTAIVRDMTQDYLSYKQQVNNVSSSLNSKVNKVQ